MRSVPVIRSSFIAPREIVFRDRILPVFWVVAVGWSLLFLR